MGQAMIASKGIWEGIIDNKLRLFFLLQVIEISKMSLLRFRRFPKQVTRLEGEATLLVLVDASSSLIIHCFLIHPTPQGIILSFLTHKCFLVSKITTIPKQELQAQNLDSNLVTKLVSEMGHLIKDFYLAGDSKVSIFWVLHDNPHKKL